MAGGSPLDAALSSGASVGRYFSVVSVIPATLLVGYLWMLTAAGAVNGPFDPHQAAVWADAGWSDLGVFLAVTLLVAVCLHPFLYGFTQFLEGYWGTSRLGTALATMRILQHRRQLFWLQELATREHAAWVDGGQQALPPDKRETNPDDRERFSRHELTLPTGDRFIGHLVREQAALKARAEYPFPGRVMPTRLGNILRRYEDTAGQQYGLDIIRVHPHLSLVAKPEHYAYVTDQGTQYDLALNLCSVSAIATVATSLLLADDGAWDFLALLPLALAYLAYRGAMAGAREYATAVAAVVDLNRTALYRAFDLPLPADGKEERATAATLLTLMDSGAGINDVVYDRGPTT